jgi:hypothetical protein
VSAALQWRALKAVFVLALLWFAACAHTWSEKARVGVNISGHALVAVDAVAADRYADETEGLTGDAFDRVDLRYARLQHAEAATREALAAVEAALNAHDAHPTDATKCAVAAAAAHAAPLLRDVARIATDLGVHVPAEITQAEDALQAAVGALLPTCHAPEAADGGHGG